MNGTTNANGYIHPGHSRAKQAKQGESVEAADADTLHRAYTLIVEALALSGEHREALRRRGLPDAEINRRGYRSFPSNGRRELASQLIELARATRQGACGR